MALKIQSPKLELQAIYAVSTAKPDIKVRLLAKINDEHFFHAPAKKAWRRIKTLIKARGEPPAWDDLVEDPSLDTDTRSILSVYESSRRVRTPDDVTALVDSLERYRRIRGHVEMAESIADALESDSGYDPDAVDETINAQIEKARGASSVEDYLTHFGSDSNASELIERVLDQSIKPALIPTGFKTFDDVNGGIPLGELMVVAGTTGGGKCLTGDSLVPTSLGMLTLRELFELRDVDSKLATGFYKLPEGITVQGRDGKGLATHIYRRRSATYRVRTSDGKEVIGSPEHRMWVCDGGDGTLSFKALKDIKVDDELLAVMGSELFASQMPLRNALMFGDFSLPSPFQVLDYAYMLLRMGSPTKRDLEFNGLFLDRKRRDFWDMCVPDVHEAIPAPKSIGGGLWRAIRTAPRKVQSQFLLVLLELGRQPGVCEQVASVCLDMPSHAVANQVGCLLNNAGILTSISHNGGNKYTVRVEDEPAHIRTMLNPSLKEKTRALLYGRYGLRRRWVSVLECGPHGKANLVYDLNVEPDHAYVVNGLLSHNSTVASVQLLKNMAIHAPAALVPLEMGRESMTSRLASNLSGIEVGKIIQKKLTEREIEKVRDGFRKWEKFLEDQDSRYTIFEPDADVSIEEILYGLQPYGFKVILIDYMSLLKGVDGDDQWKKLGEVARFAKVWGKRNNTLVILLAQLSEDGLLRYSRTVGEHAASLWRFIATAETKKEGIIKIEQGKARNQNPFSFILGIDYATMRVYDVDNPPEDIRVRGNLDDEEDVSAVVNTTRKKSSKSKPQILDDDED